MTQCLFSGFRLAVAYVTHIYIVGLRGCYNFLMNSG